MDTCYHCGDPVPAGPHPTLELDGEPRDFCCLGCQAVAQTIVAGGLEAYYRNRAESGVNLSRIENEFPPEWYDRDDVAGQFVACCGEDEREAVLLVDDVRCGACAWLIEAHLGKIPGVNQVQVNVSTHRARVTWNPGQARLSQIIRALRTIGYPAHPYEESLERRARDTRRSVALRRLAVAGLGAMQVMMYAFPHYVAGNGDLAPDIHSLLRWASLVLTLPVVTYAAWPFYQGAWRGLKARHPGMDFPVALGILIAFVGSLSSMALGHGEVYFDSVAMFVFILLAGRHLEETARSRAVQAAEGLARPAPAVAHRLVGDGEESVPATALQVGDRIQVRPGETIPADGEILSGSSGVDESLLTGESAAQRRTVGDSVIGGTLNLQNPLQVKVTAIGAQSVLAGIVRLMDRALLEKPPLAALADRIAEHFVVGLLVLAALVAGYWGLHDPHRILPVTVALLVVTCPCALSLATPAALAAATTSAMRQGLLITRGHALETLARTTHVVFDKTGTLTEGNLRLTRLEVQGDLEAGACLELAARMEAGSEHAIARALRRTASINGAGLEVVNYPGEGIEARWNGKLYRLGRAGFACPGFTPSRSPEISIDASWVTEVWLGIEGRPLARFFLADELRPESPELVASLHQRGKSLLILSGDRPEVVAALGTHLGIADARGGLTPAEKLVAIRELQAQGHVVAMVGDGLNDAPGLAGADVSLALGRAVDLAQKSADVVLITASLSPLDQAFQLGQRTLTVIRQNLAWALVYNLAAIPLAAASLVTPWLAGLGMSMSSLLVVLNALRLSRETS